jgi:hypothetical protein
MQLTEWLGPEEFWDRYDQMEQLVRESAGELPCYGLLGWSGPMTIGEWDLGSRPPMVVGVVYGSEESGPYLRTSTLQTSTTVGDPRMTIAHRRLAEGGPPSSGQDLEERLSALLSAPSNMVAMPVDGTPESFEMWRDADRWWASGRHGGNGLILEGRDVEPASLSLHRVPDIGPYLDGRRAQIRAARGGT